MLSLTDNMIARISKKIYNTFILKVKSLLKISFFLKTNPKMKKTENVSVLLIVKKCPRGQNPPSNDIKKAPPIKALILLKAFSGTI